MGTNVNISWLDDGSLTRLANDGVSDPEIWSQRFNSTCPSEFYRGYATILAQVADPFDANPNPAALSPLIEAIHNALVALPANNRIHGANFALMNVSEYARVGTAAQIATTLTAELVCIARCWSYNRTRGF